MPINIRFRAVGFLVCALFVAVTAHAADFAAKVTYKKDTPVQFAGFSLTYVGQRRVTLEKYPRGFLYYDFRIVGPHGTQTISWTSGTGDIAPLLFHVDGQGFALELQHSDKLGKLKEDELVVSRAP